MEIRVHGRGGQGGVTCAKILAAMYARQGKSVQTFGDYAGERSGAPVRAYTRVSDEPVTNRNKVYEPDHLLVLDPSLLVPATVAGLASGGTLLINSPEPPQSFADRYPSYRLATVDGTAIARRHGIGSRSVVIVNTTLAGAFARALEIPFEVLEASYRDLGFDGNLEAAREAYDGVAILDNNDPRTAEATSATPGAQQLPAVEDLVEHVAGPAPGLKTGDWRSQMPRYVVRLAVCSAACPAGNDVVGFVQALARDGEEAAAEILGRSTPFAAVCGRVCPGFCMEACNRCDLDGSVNVRGLERWVGDRVSVAPAAPEVREDAQRVAVVGGGPAGLVAAYTLALSGHRATVLEREEHLGGVLRTGIPEFRLPLEVLDREIEAIEAMGVETRCGETLTADRVAELSAEYDAVILATGLQRLRGLDMEGSDLPGVEQGIPFLFRVSHGSGEKLSGHVVVLGGGNTAMDCARTALRCGADRVTVAYRRTRMEMPAIAEEIDEAVEEGVTLLFQTAPVAFSGSGHLATIELAEVEMGPPDESGRRRPVLTDRRQRLECDTVFLALGQSADHSLLPNRWEPRDGRVWKGDTALDVFVAGDLSTGDGTVAHAIGDGRRAAGLALRALGEDVEVFERPDDANAIRVADLQLDHFEPRAAAEGGHLPASERVHDYREVNQGLEDASEAERCFSCGICTFCDSCLVYCPEGIIFREGEGYAIDYDYCKGCGVCVVECPRGAMEMVTP